MGEAQLERDLTTKKLTDWVKEPTVAELKQDYQDARGSHDIQMTRINTWLDNLHVRGKAKVNPGKNNSKVVPKLIRKQAEWRYAALSEPFLSTDDMVNVSPVTWEDKDAAIQNQLVLNHQFNNRLNKVAFIDEYVRTVVDEGTAILRTGWDFEEKEVDVEVPDVKFVVDPTLAPMHQHLAQLKAQDPEAYAAQVAPEMQQAHDLSIEHGQPIRPEIVGKKTVKQMKTVRNQPTLEVCDYRNVLIDPTCMGDIDKARFVIYSFESSLSELKKDQRYKNLDNINPEANSILGTPDHVATSADTQNFNFSDEARKKFVVYEYWGFRDLDGSGLVQPFVATWVGDTVIRMELNPFPDQKVPFVIVQYLPVRKSSYGEPDGALLEDNQKISGAVTRGMIDLMAKSANGQTGFRKDMLDLSNRRKFENGQDYEFNPTVDPRQGVYHHVFPEIPASAQFMLQLQNFEAESLTGVKAFSQGISGQGLGDVAAGVRGALDAASKRELGILRRLSAGIIEVMRKFISMNAVFLDDIEIVRVTNEEFVPVRKDDLPGSFDLKLSISTAEEDNNKAEQLAFMLQTLGNSVDQGIVMMILADIARLRKMPDLAHQLKNFKPEPDPVQQKLQELEIAKLEAEIAKLRAEAMKGQTAAVLDQAKTQTEGAKAENLAAETDRVNLDYVEQESGVHQERDLQKQGAQADAQARMKVIEQAAKAHYSPPAAKK